MNFHRYKNLTLSTLCIFLFINASQAANKVYEIKFLAEINGTPFKCGQSYKELGSRSTEIIPTDLRMYVSNIELQNNRGLWVKPMLIKDGLWQTQHVALLDFEDGSGPCINGNKPTNSGIKVEAPNQPYQAIRFEVGVPFQINHADPTIADSPLNFTSLFWNWQNGYRFIKFDARIAASNKGFEKQTSTGIKNSGFSFHLGSTECASTSSTTSPKECKNPNRVFVELTNYSPETGRIVIDIAKIFINTDLGTNTPQTSPGCMSFGGDPDCNEIMSLLGLSYQGKTPNHSQKLIFVR